MTTQKYNVNSLEQLRQIAEERNCTLVVAQRDDLLIDKDDREPLSDAALALIREKFGQGARFEVERWPSRGGGTHYRVQLSEDLPPLAAIALQAALGSDPIREILAVWEHMISVRQQTPDPEDTRSLFKPQEGK